MILTINNLAKTYGLLPTEVLARATTFDLYVLDVSARWQQHQHEQITGKKSFTRPPPKLSEREMLDMLKRARSGE